MIFPHQIFPSLDLSIKLANFRNSMEYLTEHLGLERQIDIKMEVYNSVPSEVISKQEGTHKITLLNQKSSSTNSVRLSDKHTCYVCNKVLSSTSSYYVHMKQHSGNKPYHCPMCDVSFCRKPYLEVHLRTHTGERPFQCNVCLKRFTQKSSLNIHKRVHTGERPYSCNFCDKKFAVKSYVDAHRWTHVSEKPLSCEKCRIPFNSKAQYALHMKSHSTALSHECMCGRTFTKNSYLIRHQIKVHHPPSTSFTIDDNSSSSDLVYNPIFATINSSSKKNYEINSLISSSNTCIKKADKQTNTDSFKRSFETYNPNFIDE